MKKAKNNISMKKAQKLADITFKLKKICNEKESYFAQQFKLTSMEFRCLKYLKDCDFLIVKDLAYKMNLTPSRVTRLITSLENKKLVTRELDLDDRRNVRVMLNKKSKEMVEDLDQKHTELHAEVLSTVPQKEVEQMIDSIEKLYEVFEIWAEKNLKHANLKNLKDY